jgi:pimeloyl-ACP methyl ester carboxylesterase
VEVVERTEEIAGLPIRWRSAGEAPVLYVHGVPTASWEGLPFLERTGGIAPDLPGFGRSAKRADLDYSIPGYVRFLEEFTQAVGLDRMSLVVHDWGAVGLAFAQRHPERFERIVAINCVPLLPGYRWHRIARIWRTPLLGELSMGLATKWSVRQLLREANVTPGPMPQEFVDRVWENLDQGTQRAILKLYRSAPPEVLEAEGGRLGELRCRALVVWSTKDPYIPERFGAAYADALGGETTLELVEAGHWAWLDRPEVVDRVAAFIRADAGS